MKRARLSGGIRNGPVRYAGIGTGPFRVLSLISRREKEKSIAGLPG